LLTTKSSLRSAPAAWAKSIARAIRASTATSPSRFCPRLSPQTARACADSSEKRAFDLLLGVQHVGPKAALSILSVLSPEDLVKAISREDLHRIDAVPGVGTKLAERIVRELRDKIANLKFGGEPRPAPAQAASQNGMGTIGDDAVSALVNLAYKPIQAQRAVDAVMVDDAGADLETIIRKSLAVLLAEK